MRFVESKESVDNSESLSTVSISGPDGGVILATLDFATHTWRPDDGGNIPDAPYPVEILAPRGSGAVLVEMKADGTFVDVP
jgi:hypothetical protein